MGFVTVNIATNLLNPAQLLSFEIGNRSIPEVLVLPSFSIHTAEEWCSDPGDIDRTQCIVQAVESIRDFKRAQFYKQIFRINRDINGMLHSTDWAYTAFEGNSAFYYDKTFLLQRISDDPRVRTICEIGFNAGYSALNFLLSNPVADFVTFDTFQHPYSHASVQVLHNMFPNRTIVPIVGLSGFTVPQFINLFPNFRCNLMLIDGSHQGDDVIKDIENMRRLADPQFHRVVIDDVEITEVMNHWNMFAQNPSNKFRVMEYTVEVEFSQLNISRADGRYNFNLQRPTGVVESVMVVGEYIV